MDLNLEQCPTCGTELSQTKYREIKAKLRAEQEKKDNEIAEARAAIKREAQEEFKLQLEQQRRTLTKQIRGESDQSVKKALAEVEQLAKKLKAAEEREANIRKEAKAEIETQKQSAAKKAKEEARQETQSEIKKLTAERDNVTKQLAQAKERESEIRKQAQQQGEKQRQTDLTLQREALEKDKDSALSKQQAQFNRVRESLERQVTALQRKVQNNTANELGDAGEIDIFETLRDTFRGDIITRVKKGELGPDIRHEVMYKGEQCGVIITDSKNQEKWQYAWVAKIRQDQTRAGAEHAIIATTILPAGKKHMCIESGVVVTLPGQVLHIVQLMRQAMVAAHIKGLSLEQRATKMGRLYALITSEAYGAKFAELARLAHDILDLDVKEKAAHDITWRKRGTFGKRMQNVLREIDTDVAAIIEHNSPTVSTALTSQSARVNVQNSSVEN